MEYVELDNLTLQERLSALYDGELSAIQAAALVQASLAQDDVMQSWGSMSAISHVLRESHTRPWLAPTAAPVNTKPVHAAAIPEAANDSVFRWKMVAGLAAFAAVGSLAWGLLGSLGDKTDTQSGTVLAQGQTAAAGNKPNAALIAVGGQIAGQEVTILRDPRLDELLAAHKQFGGASALQQPAGSLRSVSLGGTRP